MGDSRNPAERATTLAAAIEAHYDTGPLEGLAWMIEQTILGALREATGAYPLPRNDGAGTRWTTGATPTPMPISRGSMTSRSSPPPWPTAPVRADASPPTSDVSPSTPCGRLTRPAGTKCGRRRCCGGGW